MTRDSILIEIRNLKEQQAGISPKTETWKTIQSRLEELYKKIGSTDHAPFRKSPKLVETIVRRRFDS